MVKKGKGVILVTGAFGQIGTALLPALARRSRSKVIASDLRIPALPLSGHVIFEKLDVTNCNALEAIIKKHQVTTIYHLAAFLSGTSEKDPARAWRVNVDGLRNVLESAKKYHVRVFWPSSIAVFGPTTPRKKVQQHTVIEPTTIYGTTKYFGELLCQYYHRRYGVDVRSVRYPGVIGGDKIPSGGTTDYAMEIFSHALNSGRYTSFVRRDTTLPMIHIDDAIRAALLLMDTPAKKLSLRLGYNIAGLSFSLDALAKEITKHHKLRLFCKPDFRQKIADSWPESIDDSSARRDWGWKPQFARLDKLVPRIFDELKNVQN